MSESELLMQEKKPQICLELLQANAEELCFTLSNDVAQSVRVASSNIISTSHACFLWKFLGKVWAYSFIGPLILTLLLGILISDFIHDLCKICVNKMYLKQFV